MYGVHKTTWTKMYLGVQRTFVKTILWNKYLHNSKLIFFVGIQTSKFTHSDGNNSEKWLKGPIGPKDGFPEFVPSCEVSKKSLRKKLGLFYFCEKT